MIEYDDGERKSITHEVHVGEHMLKSIDFKFITDSEIYRTKSCDRLYFLHGGTLLASNFGEECYTNFEFTQINTTSNRKMLVSIDPELKFIHSFYATIDTSKSSQLELIHDTLRLESNLEIDLSDQIIYDNLQFTGNHETFFVDLVFPLYIERE